jgi:hypothetical protein
MRLAESVAASDQGSGFLVIHGHAAKGAANVGGRRNRVGTPLGPSGFT